MPSWLKTVARLNPLSYVVDVLHTFMLAGSKSTFGLGRDYAVIRSTTILVVIGGSILVLRRKGQRCRGWREGMCS